MSRWRPQRLATQLALLFALALLASHLAAAIFLQYAGALMHPLSRSQALERLDMAVQATRRMKPDVAAALLETLAAAPTRVWVAEDAEVPPTDMQREEIRLSHDLRARAGLPADREIRMQLERVTGEHARAGPFSAAAWRPLHLRSSIALPDGRWLNAVQYPSTDDGWLRPMLYALPMSVLPVLGILLFLLRRVVRPVRRLATAAERLSIGETPAALPVYGPLEARELTEAFNAMQVRVQTLLSSRTHMLAAISHDLNTPITALRLQVELLPPSPERDDMLESLAELRIMTSETLAFMRDDTAAEATIDVDLAVLIDSLVQRYRRMGAAVEWSGTTEQHCRVRPLALKRALGNLVDNALRYGGSADIRLHAPTEGMIAIDVLDTGPGIPPAMLERVTDPFVRLGTSGPITGPARSDAGEGLDLPNHNDASSRDATGTGVGLGLAIVESVVHAHGGELRLANRQPQGLQARICLPVLRS